MMSKRHYLAMLLLVVCQLVMATPARRGVYKTLRLSDGRELRAMLVGDEFGRFWRGDDGRAYVPDGDCYVLANEKAIMAQANARRAVSEAKTARRLAARRAGNTKGYFGEKRSLVILVNYTNKVFKAGHDADYFQRILNEEHFEEAPFMGSVADYFRDQSRGQFQLSFDVVGPVTLSKWGMSAFGSESDLNNFRLALEETLHEQQVIPEQVALPLVVNDFYKHEIFRLFAAWGACAGITVFNLIVSIFALKIKNRDS